jgi:hypothetical protein
MEGETSTTRMTAMIATLRARVDEPEAIIVAARKLIREREICREDVGST